MSLADLLAAAVAEQAGRQGRELIGARMSDLISGGGTAAWAVGGLTLIGGFVTVLVPVVVTGWLIAMTGVMGSALTSDSAKKRVEAFVEHREPSANTKRRLSGKLLEQLREKAPELELAVRDDIVAIFDPQTDEGRGARDRFADMIIDGSETTPGLRGAMRARADEVTILLP